LRLCDNQVNEQEGDPDIACAFSTSNLVRVDVTKRRSITSFGGARNSGIWLWAAPEIRASVGTRCPKFGQRGWCCVIERANAKSGPAPVWGCTTIKLFPTFECKTVQKTLRTRRLLNQNRPIHPHSCPISPTRTVFNTPTQSRRSSVALRVNHVRGVIRVAAVTRCCFRATHWAVEGFVLLSYLRALFFARFRTRVLSIC